jgi:hypothetical protein
VLASDLADFLRGDALKVFGVVGQALADTLGRHHGVVVGSVGAQRIQLTLQ